MKKLRFTLILFFALILSFPFYSCVQQKPEDDQISKRVQELENKVESLQKRVDDQMLKTRIVSSMIFKSPLEQFFQSPEFWENTYDSGQADCSKRCIDELTATRKECEKKVDENERLLCFQQATDRASNCHKQCARL